MSEPALLIRPGNQYFGLLQVDLYREYPKFAAILFKLINIAGIFALGDGRQIWIKVECPDRVRLGGRCQQLRLRCVGKAATAKPRTTAGAAESIGTDNVRA